MGDFMTYNIVCTGNDQITSLEDVEAVVTGDITSLLEQSQNPKRYQTHMIQVRHEEIKLPLSDVKFDQAYYLDYNSTPVLIYPTY